MKFWEKFSTPTGVLNFRFKISLAQQQMLLAFSLSVTFCYDWITIETELTVEPASSYRLWPMLVLIRFFFYFTVCTQ